MKASDVLVRNFINFGVDTIYGVPGEENIDLVDSIRKSGQIKLIVTRNEQTAVFMAATYGRLTGKPGIALSTLGPGATNLVTGVSFAQLGGFPVIVITGQKPIKTSKQGFFQIIDIVSLMKPITKFSSSIIGGSKISYIFNNAYRMAASERPGASCLELPEDIAGEEVEDCSNQISTEKRRRPVIDEKGLYNLKYELENAKYPIILIGAGSNRKRINRYLTYFIEKYNIPFFTSQMGKGVVDESMKEYIGTAAVSDNDYIHEAIKQSDLILSVGYDPIEKPTHLVGKGGIKTIHINFFESSLDNVYSPYMDVVGDIGNTFWQIYEIGVDSSNRDFEEIYKLRDEYFEKINQNIKYEDVGNEKMGPRKLVSDTRKFMGKEDIVALDNGLYKVFFARNYICYNPNTLLLDNALATMGAGMASGLEAKRINNDKNVLVVTGDGGLVMNLGDLETAVRLDLDLIIVVLNNNSYGMIKWKQVGENFPMWGMDFNNPDFVKLAESFGAKGYKVYKKNEYLDTLKKANSEKGVKIIDVDFDYTKEIN